MSHYFTDQKDTKSHRKTIHFHVASTHFTFVSDHGVFSKDAVDHATVLLLETVDIAEGETVLDLGCGYGPIGIVLSKVRGAQVTMSDVNPRAIALAKANVDTNGVAAKIVESDGFNLIEGCFNHIVINPPIRIGKEAMYAMLREAHTHLEKNGILWVVIHKKHGAHSLERYLADYYDVERAQRHKGIYVFACRKALTP